MSGAETVKATYHVLTHMEEMRCPATGQARRERTGHGRASSAKVLGVACAERGVGPRGGGASRCRPLSSPEAGWAEPGLWRGLLSTSGSVSASPWLSLGSPPLPPPALLGSARSGSTWRAGLSDWPVCGPPGTRLTAVPWRAPARSPACARARPRPPCACAGGSLLRLRIACALSEFSKAL